MSYLGLKLVQLSPSLILFYSRICRIKQNTSCSQLSSTHDVQLTPPLSVRTQPLHLGQLVESDPLRGILHQTPLHHLLDSPLPGVQPGHRLVGLDVLSVDEGRTSVDQDVRQTPDRPDCSTVRGVGPG